MKVLVVFSNPIESFGQECAVPPDGEDIIHQKNRVIESLKELGYDVSEFPATLDLDDMRSYLTTHRPDVIFNLVESAGGYDSLLYLAPFLWDAMEIPYTGSHARALYETTNKRISKEILCRFDIRVPFAPHYLIDSNADIGDYIIKGVYDHGSHGMQDDSVIKNATHAILKRKLQERRNSLKRDCFAEQFIEGRECNISILSIGNGDLEILPISEIDFSELPEGKPHIVGYRAKWAGSPGPGRR